MEQFIAYFAGLSLIIATIFRFHTLGSKSDIGRIFLTDEQKLKAYFYNLFILSILIAFLSGIFCVLIQNKDIGENPSEVFGMAAAIVIVVFIVCFLSIGTIVKWIHNFLIKEYFKFQINLPEIGDVYIIRMLNKEVCICSNDSSIESDTPDKNSYLVSMDSIIHQPITKRKFTKPKKTVIQKIFD